MSISSRKVLIIAWRACLCDLLWQGFNTSNTVLHYNKTSLLYVYDKNGVIICLQGQGKCPFWVMGLKHSFRQKGKFLHPWSRGYPTVESTLSLLFHSKSWSLNDFNTLTMSITYQDLITQKPIIFRLRNSSKLLKEFSNIFQII